MSATASKPAFRIGQLVEVAAVRLPPLLVGEPYFPPIFRQGALAFVQAVNVHGNMTRYYIQRGETVAWCDEGDLGFVWSVVLDKAYQYRKQRIRRPR